MVFAGLLAAAFIMLALLPLAGVPPGVRLAAITLLPAVSAARRTLAAPDDTSKLVPAQLRTLQAFTIFAIGGGVGILLG
jgi:1,4-dihydroxy-2-naphthoate octaprenyltransferase